MEYRFFLGAANVIYSLNGLVRIMSSLSQLVFNGLTSSPQLRMGAHDGM